MALPGNILRRAMQLTGGTMIQWYAATGRTINAIGLDVTAYATPVGITAQVQPVPRTMFQVLGLDMAKDYIMIYTYAAELSDIGRDRSGDQIVYAGDRYQLMNNTEWFPINGWNGTIAAKLPPIAPPPT